MARRRKYDNGEDRDAGQGHNSEEGSVIETDPAIRAQIIDQTVRQVALLEAQRKELGEKIRALKSANIKGRLGQKIGDFNATFRLFNLDDDGRTAFLRTMHETFVALGAGEQLDWLAGQPAAQRPVENLSL